VASPRHETEPMLGSHPEGPVATGPYQGHIGPRRRRGLWRRSVFRYRKRCSKARIGYRKRCSKARIGYRKRCSKVRIGYRKRCSKARIGYRKRCSRARIGFVMRRSHAGDLDSGRAPGCLP
jgi:hypothetical protein